MIGPNRHIKVIDYGDAKFLDPKRNEEFNVDKETENYKSLGIDDSDCEIIQSGTEEEEEKEVQYLINQSETG
jgi:hypothetical protein